MTDIKPTTAVLQALHMLYTIYRMDSADSDRLAAETNLDRRTLTGTINLAVSKGLVLRTERKIGTKRAYYYSITTKGRDALAKETSPSTTAAPPAAAPDKPGVSESETTPEAAIAHLSPFQGEGAARHETPSTTGVVQLSTKVVEGDGSKGQEAMTFDNDLSEKLWRALNSLLMIGTITSQYMPDGSAITEGVRTMDLLIDGHNAEIQRLHEKDAENQRMIDALHTSLKQDVDTEMALAQANADLRSRLAMVSNIRSAIGDYNATIPFESLPGAIDLIIDAHMAEINRLDMTIQEDRKISDRAIYSHVAEIGRLEHELTEERRLHQQTRAELASALRIIDDFAQAPATEAPYDGPFIIAAGWREAEASQKAYDIARDMAMTSAGGVAIVARPLRVATVSIEMKDYGHVPASQPAAAA